jgi:hypothetical protein
MKLGVGGILLLGVTTAFAGAPLPNSSYLGIAKTISMTGYNGTGTAGGGGAFNGTLSGFATTLWCVDDQLYFAFNQFGLANVIGLNQITPDDTRVRYGNVHNPGNINQWTNGGDPDTFTAPDSAQERYRMAAYLVSQYDFLSLGDAQSGLNGSDKNNAIQNTIWALTNNNSTTAQNPGVIVPDASWLTEAKNNYLTVDMTRWAVVSWTVDDAGKLGTGVYGAEDGARQTFLVQVVPEPGFYGMVSLGLSGLLVAFYRRKKNEQSAS